MESTNTPAIKAVADLQFRFTKKPVTIEAALYEGAGNFRDHMVPDWIWMALESGAAFNRAGDLVIKTLEGDMVAAPGDWVIRGLKGELYPCKPDIFALSYEPAATPAIQAVAPIPAWREQLFAIAPEYEGKGLIDIPMSAQVVGLNAEVKALRAALGHSAAVPAQQPTDKCGGCNGHGMVGNILDSTECPFCLGSGRAAAPVAPDLASLHQFNTSQGVMVRLIDVERLLSHSAQAPVEPVSALTDERIANNVIAIGRQFHSWGMGYVQDQTGAWTIPRLPKCLQDFSRALLAASPKAEPTDEKEFLSTLSGAAKEATDEWIAGFVRQHFGCPKVEPVSEDKRDAELPRLYRFDRINKGRVMAEGIGIHATSMEDAKCRARKMMQPDDDEIQFRSNQRCADRRCEVCNAYDAAFAATPSPTKEST